LHWFLSSEPVVLSDWWDDMLISLPRSGSAAHVYYRRRPTEPALVDELIDRLEPGGVFVDIGAHIGLYSLIAARRVGPDGRVFAIEPQEACWAALHTNLSLNGLVNVTLVPGAAGDEDGRARFSSISRSMSGMVTQNGESDVPIFRLDTFARDASLRRIDVLKIDTAGSEYSALSGAAEHLEEHRIGAILCKLYNPTDVADRFGYDVSLIVELLREANYVVSALPTDTQPRVAVRDRPQVPQLFDWATYSRTLLAVPSLRT
jgi:FkbM family methyltransferase